MLLFLLLILPVSLILYLYTTKLTKVAPVILIGFITSVLVCGFRAFVLYSHRVVPYSFEGNFIYILIREYVLPVIVLYLLYFFITKDKVEYKVEAFIPLMLGFYSVYLPYVVISGTDSVYSGFEIFVKPVLIMVMIYQLGFIVQKFYKFLCNRKILLLVLCVIAGLIYIVVPSLLETLYLLKYNVFLLIGGSVLYTVASILFYITSMA